MPVSLMKPERVRLGLTNYSRVPIPGTDVVAYFGVWDSDPSTWTYSLWTPADNGEEDLIAVGQVDVGDLPVIPEQVARIAYLLEVDYSS